jgi:hypothetical protein
MTRTVANLTCSSIVPESLAERVGARQAWDSSLDRLAEDLAKA